MEPHTAVILALVAVLVIALVGAIRPRSMLPAGAAEHQLLLARLITLLVACVCAAFLLVEAL
ncbi:hypothetical protein [Kutzneria sp. CA-103260]|uniref:hypothetical protein n=1 Tax=Kutzneria sp. CA-103260 TaxID=2802641 RepID=UPI001BA6D506|nr:hypothetical protein [Kutzneria sp. CA-103260]QUQ66177.1 hypothetical protein JJ691_39030 [Kutzneria sp. CA-103260]